MIDWNRGKTKLRWRLADENCQRMLVLRPLDHDVRSLHAGIVELCLSLGYVCLWGSPAFETILRQLERIAVCLDRVVQQLLLCVSVAHSK